MISPNYKILLYLGVEMSLGGALVRPIIQK